MKLKPESLPRWLRWPNSETNHLLPWWWILWGCIWIVPFLLSKGLAALFYGLGRLSIEDGLEFWNNT
jgi:hypothetical protein